MDWDVIISGAGLGGLCAASGLLQSGLRVLVLERDQNATSRRQGYRININLAGDAALRACLPSAHYGLYQETSHSQLDPSVDIFTPELKPVFHRVAEVSQSDPPPAAVDRGMLRATLLDAAGNVRFGASVVDAVERENAVEVELGDGTKLTCGLLIAADGAGSLLRQKLLPGHEPQPLGAIAIYGKAPLCFDTSGLTWLPDKVLHQRFVGLTDGAGTTLALGGWNPRRSPREAAGKLILASPLPETTPYVMWVLMNSSASAPDAASSAEQLHAFAWKAIQHWHPAATQFVRGAEVAATFRITLQATQSVPDWPAGRITFLGDAIHAMSPAGGEGANTAMADAALLVSAYKAHGVDGIAAYEEGMRQRARAALERSMKYGRTVLTGDSHHD